MLLEKLQEDLKEAQLQRDEAKVSTLRLLLSEAHNLKIQKGGELTDADLIGVLQKEVKKRVESAQAFRSGGREEMALKEETEAGILQSYLPTQLTEEELSLIVDTAITEAGASAVSDMGKVIGLVMGKVAGQADGGRVSAMIKERLLKNG